jgi:EAL domain-containing protein (putative c-di-GMP-specific phosphodiesterase class I)
VTGVEALLRWRLPEQGEVSPAQFIPIAEETGLIVQIGAWVLEQACRQQAEWVRQGLRPIRMAVNIAGRQLREPGFCSMVAAIVERSGIAPQLLEIEVTESELMGEVDQAARVLVQLAAMGVGIAVDDFGTGHSSLARLHALSVDRLKVDRSFVLAMGEGGKGAAIPRAILALAESLGLASVAEGVETEAQASLLQEWGCGEMQGYLFSRPVPAAQIAALLQ